MIYIDRSELRKNSRLYQHRWQLHSLFGGSESLTSFLSSVSTVDLEELTGADIMISPLHMPVTSSTLAHHISAGAALIQLKFGRDLLSSLGVRLKSSLYKMRKSGAKQRQCILIFVGDIGAKDNLATVDGQEVQPSKHYLAVTTSIYRWGQRGGIYLPVSREQFLPSILHSILRDIEMERAGVVKEEIWDVPSYDGADFDGDVLNLTKVEDWRVVLAAIPGVGPTLATNLRNTMLELGIADTLANALVLATMPKKGRKEKRVKITGWGEKTHENVRGYVLGNDRNAIGDARLILALEKEKEKESKTT